MKGIELKPTIEDENVLVQFTEETVVDKHTSIKIPNGYEAMIFIDEQLLFRSETAMSKKIAEVDKTYLKKHCRVAFLRKKSLAAMYWGFGNIQVNNERLQEAYRVGANGQYQIAIAEKGRLLNYFDNSENITIDMIREKTISVLKNIGVSLVGKMFANTKVSVFEVASLTMEFRNALMEQLKQESIFADMGIALKDLTVDGIHVNEQDIELIRERLNG